MDGGTVVALVSLSAFIVLVAGSSELRRLTTERKALFAVIWAIVIGVLAFVLARMGL